MPELITINYFTDLIHFFIYLTIIYYMLYNIVWNKLRTFYYVNLSKTLNRKKVTLTYLYFTINYIYSLLSTILNKNILLLINLLSIQQRTIVYDIKKAAQITEKEIPIISTFYLQNTYFETTNLETSSQLKTNESIRIIY